MFGKTKLSWNEIQAIRLEKNNDHFANYIPTLTEIALGCAEIQAGWDAETRRSRCTYKTEWASAEEAYLALHFRAKRPVLCRKKLDDCKLCDSEYWQYAIEEQLE